MTFIEIKVFHKKKLFKKTLKTLKIIYIYIYYSTTATQLQDALETLSYWEMFICLIKF